MKSCNMRIYIVIHDKDGKGRWRLISLKGDCSLSPAVVTTGSSTVASFPYDIYL